MRFTPGPRSYSDGPEIAQGESAAYFVLPEAGGKEWAGNADSISMIEPNLRTSFLRVSVNRKYCIRLTPAYVFGIHLPGQK